MMAYVLYNIGYFLATRLPACVGYPVVTLLSLLKYKISPRDRRAVIGNLLRILPREQRGLVPVYARSVFINFGKYLLEFFRIKYLTKNDHGRFIKITGKEHLDRARGMGHGVIVLTAHMGNWELGGVFMSLLGYPFMAVALPHRNRRVNNFFNRQRGRIGVEVVPSMGVGLRRIYGALKANKLVALVGDRDFAGSGIKMNFLGAQKMIPRGPAVLSLRTGAPIVPGFVIRQPDNGHVIEFLEPIFPQGTEEQIMSAYVRIIEEKIRRYPDQWLMFREFWKE